jgi:hypothetical protein
MHLEIHLFLLLRKYYQMRNQATLGELEELRFTLCQQFQMSSHSKFWVPNREFTGFLKSRARHQVTGNMLLITRWASVGLETRGCLDRSTRGGLFWKVHLQKETKEGRMGSYLHYGAFLSWPWAHFMA